MLNRDKIKVLYISNMSDYSGGEIVLERLILNNPSVEAFVALPSGKFADRLLKNNINIFVVDSLRSLNRENNKLYLLKFIILLLKNSFYLIQIICRYRFFLVVANGAGVALYSALASRITNTKSLWIHHHPILQPSTTDYRIAPMMVNLVSKVICVSDAIRNSFLQSGADKEKLLTIHNGLDINEFDDKKYETGFLRQTYSIPNHTVLIGILATITEWKGHHILLKAIEHLQNNGMAPGLFKCLIIGDVLNSNPVDLRFYEYLRKSVIMQGLSDEIIFTGRINDTKEAYKDLDIVLNCSVQPEPLGTTIYEGMAMRKVVIATNVGGSVEIIEHRVNGFLIEPGDPIQLADQLKEVILSPAYRQEIGEKARQKVLLDFNVITMVDKYNQLFEDLISK